MYSCKVRSLIPNRIKHKTKIQKETPQFPKNKKDRVHHCSRPQKKLESYKKIKLFLNLCNNIHSLLYCLHIERDKIVITLGKSFKQSLIKPFSTHHRTNFKQAS